jgi:uridine kinase
VISGSVGSGKSTIASNLSKLLKDAPLLKFDDYEKYVEWPEDLTQWMKEGYKADQIRVPRLKEDIVSLLNGDSIIYPVDSKIVNPQDYILLEDPTGREREEVSEIVDLVIFIDVPQDVCVTRMIQRELKMDIWLSEGTFRAEKKEYLVEQLDSIASWIEQYQRARLMYITVSEVVKKNSDIIVNGLLSVDEIAMKVLEEMRAQVV